MITAHVYETAPGVWSCTDWPTQQVVVNNHQDRDAAKTAWLAYYNAELDLQLTAEQVRFAGPLLLTVYVREIDEGWEAEAHGPRQVYRLTAPTEAEVKTQFLEMWNTEHDTTYVDENVDWT